MFLIVAELGLKGPSKPGSGTRACLERKTGEILKSWYIAVNAQRQSSAAPAIAHLRALDALKTGRDETREERSAINSERRQQHNFSVSLICSRGFTLMNAQQLPATLWRD
jgi:hypothetical protein